MPDNPTLSPYPQARELLENGIETNPLYAPLYHSLAELEARVFNIEALAKLSTRIAELFPPDASASLTESSSSSTQRMQAWGKKIRQQGIPKGIAALAEKIGVDDDGDGANTSLVAGGSLDDVDPELLISSMNGFGLGGDGSDDGFMMFPDTMTPESIK